MSLNIIPRTTKPSGYHIELNDSLIEVDLVANTVVIGSNTSSLTSQEMRIIELLCVANGKPVSKQALYSHMTGKLEKDTAQRVDGNIRAINRKLQRKLIVKALVGEVKFNDDKNGN